MAKYISISKKILAMYKKVYSFLSELSAEFLNKVRRAEQISTIISAIIIGILGAFGAILFRYIIQYSQNFFNSIFTFTSELVSYFPWYMVIIIPGIGGLIVGLIVYYFAPEVKGSGVPEVMESAARHGGIIRLRVLITKTIAAAVTIGSGGSAGREGPIIHIGSAIGSAFGQLMGISPQKMRTFVACGAASGIAATFNAPIAGALFAVEVIIGDFAVPAFSPIVISSVTATVLSRYFIGDFPAFDVPSYELVSSIEFIPYSILGVLAGIIAVLFIKSLFGVQEGFNKLNMPEYFKPAIGGLVVGAIAIMFPEVLGVGYESINAALLGRDVELLLLLLIFLKIIATSFTLGSGGSGGIFAPSLFIGAMLGALIGEEAQHFFPGQVADVGAYALVGMGAVVSATTHAPITAILIIFELTNDYRIIPPLMLACIVGVLISTWLKKESIYTMKLVQRGVNIFEGRDINIMKRLTVGSALNPNPECVLVNNSFSELLKVILGSEHDVILVTTDGKKLVGMITLQKIKEFILDKDLIPDLVIAADLMERPFGILNEKDNLDLVMHQLGKYNIDELPVIADDGSNRIVGTVRRMDVIKAYNKEIFKIDLTGGMHSILKGVHKEREIEVSGGVKLKEIEPPTRCYNRSIKDINIRAKYGLEIIMIKNSVETDDGIVDRPGTLPSADYTIKPGDILLVLGTVDNIKNFQLGIPDKNFQA